VRQIIIYPLGGIDRFTPHFIQSLEFEAKTDIVQAGILRIKECENKVVPFEWSGWHGFG
jgi:hypothetical protein